jgi:isochorismate hydrolase
MMNTYQHPDADALVPNVGKIIEPLTDLVRRARDSDDVDLVYVNDNFGDFTAQFSETPVADLLNRLGTERVILTDQVTEQCILYSALDAYVRHFQVVVPTDGVAHIDPDLGAAALNMMEQNMSAELTTAADCLC